MTPQELRRSVKSSSLQLLVNWFLGECYRTYLTNGRFFDSLLGKRYTLEQVQRFARVFGVYRCRYPKLLGIDVILSSFEREEWKSSAHHLLEELGGGPGCKTHGELYAAFLIELGLPVEPGLVISGNDAAAFVDTFYSNFESYCRSGSTVERKTILAIFELVDNADYASLYSGLIQYQLPDSSLLFFKIHAEAAHWENSKAEIENFWADQRHRNEMIGAFEFLLKLQQDLYEGMHDWIIEEDTADKWAGRDGDHHVVDVSSSAHM